MTIEIEKDVPDEEVEMKLSIARTSGATNIECHEQDDGRNTIVAYYAPEDLDVDSETQEAVLGQLD